MSILRDHVPKLDLTRLLYSGLQPSLEVFRFRGPPGGERHHQRPPLQEQVDRLLAHQRFRLDFAPQGRRALAQRQR